MMEMSPPTLSKEDKKWRARNDADYLAESEVIKNDPVRLLAAKRAAIEIARERKENADAMKAVARTKPSVLVRKKAKPKKKESNKHNVFKRL